MRKLVGTAVGAAVIGTALPAGAAPLAEAKPTASWQVDFGDQRCVALRSFEVDGRPVVMAIEPNPDGSGSRVLFRLSEGIGQPVVGFERATFSINGKKVSDGISLWPGERQGQLLMTGAREDEEGAIRLAEIKEVSLDSPQLKARMALTGMARVAGLLERCNGGLLASWGFAEADQARLANWPKLAQPISRIFSYQDYPRESLREGQQGEVRARVSVGADGKPQGCAVRYGSGWPSLDQATCRLLLERARFEPARDKAGQPMAAPSFHTVRWRVPR